MTGELVTNEQKAAIHRAWVGREKKVQSKKSSCCKDPKSGINRVYMRYQKASVTAAASKANMVSE